VNISELFEKIQDQLNIDDLNGEFTLHGNCIVWLFNLENNCEEIEISENDDDEFDFYSSDVSSTEELLQEAYNSDLEMLNELLDELEEIDNWNTSDYEIVENTISFKIF
jgi:hypothetical protein